MNWTQKENAEIRSPEKREEPEPVTEPPVLPLDGTVSRGVVETYNGRAGRLLSIQGKQVCVERMMHDDRSACELAAALLDYLSGHGRPLSVVSSRCRVVAYTIRDYLAVPF